MPLDPVEILLVVDGLEAVGIRQQSIGHNSPNRCHHECDALPGPKEGEFTLLRRAQKCPDGPDARPGPTEHGVMK